MAQTQTFRSRPIQRAANWAFCQTFGRKYTGGPTIKAAIKRAKKLNERGCRVILNVLGEHFTSIEKVRNTRNSYLQLLDAMKEHGIRGSISLKPTELGFSLKQDDQGSTKREDIEAYTRRNMYQVVEKAHKLGIAVEFDMEDRDTFAFTVQTYNFFRSWIQGSTLLLALQANVRLSLQVLTALIQSSTRDRPCGVRLTKGIYDNNEPGLLKDSEVIAHLIQLIRMAVMSSGPEFLVALGSHHSKVIDEYLYFIQESKKEFLESQILFGVKNDLIPQLQEKEIPAAVYLGFGEHAFAYSFRRMRKNPGFFWKIMTKIFERKYRLEVESDKIHAPTEAKGVELEAPTPIKAQLPRFDSDKSDEELRA